MTPRRLTALAAVGTMLAVIAAPLANPVAAHHQQAPRAQAVPAAAALHSDASRGASTASDSSTVPDSDASPSSPADPDSPAAPARPEVVNDEVVLAELDPTGLPERAVLVSRVTVEGDSREVVDPGSGTNVRYLDRLGRPEVGPDGVILTVGGDRPTALTQARFDKPLPVALHAEYAVDGAVVPADEVPGASGEIRVGYTLTNTTSEPTELTYIDAAGVQQTETKPVFVPFQGALTVTLPEGAELVEAPHAMLATDDQGRTVVRWNISLFPPISSPFQHVALTMRAERTGVPGAEVVLTPSGQDQDPATGFAAALLTGTTVGNATLYAGLATLDRAAGTLAQRADELAIGLAGLASGAQGAASASTTLAAGVGDLADGSEQAADASNELADGVDTIAGGADRSAGAATDLAHGVDQLAAGADTVAAGNRELAGALGVAATGAQDLADATAALAAATAGSPADQLEPLLVGGAAIEGGLLEASGRIGSPSDPVLGLTDPLPPDADNVCPPGGTAPPDDDCVTIYQGVRALRDGLAAVDAVAGLLEPRLDDLRVAIVELLDELARIGSDATDAAQGAADLLDQLCDPTAPVLDQRACDQLQAVADAAADAATGADDAAPIIEEVVAALKALDNLLSGLFRALDTALASTERLLDGVAEIGLAVGTGTTDTPGLATAMAQLNAGLAQLAEELATSQEELNRALDAVASGSADLAGGIDGTAAGSEELAQGAQGLADGAGGAATGADQLAGGLDMLAEGADAAVVGADQLADGSQELAAGADVATAGADQLAGGLTSLAQGAGSAQGAGALLAGGALALRRDGTAPAADSVLSASEDPALARAWLEAAAARAADALPYGPPEGAQGNTAYVFSLAEVAAPQSLWERIRAMFGG